MPSEHKIQTALMDYLAIVAKPEIFYFAIPNQSNRHIFSASKMKAEGVRSGVADLCFMLPAGRVGWLEMKTQSGTLSATQKVFRDRALALGHFWAMARSVDEALPVLTEWGVLKDAYRDQGYRPFGIVECVRCEPGMKCICEQQKTAEQKTAEEVHAH
jgi:hypothetical protein